MTTSQDHYGDLDLAPIGNCTISSLIDRMGRIVWSCAPRFDSDPIFSNLLSGRDPASPDAVGLWAIDIVDCVEVKQEYLRNTAVLRTELTDKNGGSLEILDFALSPIRPHLSAHGDPEAGPSPAWRAQYPRSTQAHHQLGRPVGRADLWLEPYPVSVLGRDLASHHQWSDLAHPQ